MKHFKLTTQTIVSVFGTKLFRIEAEGLILLLTMYGIAKSMIYIYNTK